MRDERGLTPCTIDQWRRQVATFLRWCGDTDRDLAMLQSMDVDAYFVTDRAQRWSRISAGHIAKMLRVFLRHAASTGACSATLADSIQGSRQYALESLPYALSWDDVRRVIAGADANTERDIRDRAILLLLSVYGLRRGEVAALRLDQIDRVGGRLHIWRLKRCQPRLVPIGPQLAAALVAYYEQRSKLPTPKTKDSAFLCSRTGGRLTYPQVVTLFQRIRSDAGIVCPPGESRPPRLHDLRHTAAAHRVLAWYRAGLNVQQLLPRLATYLGHASIASTQRYLQMTPELLQQASCRFAAYALQDAEQGVDHA